MMDLSRMTAEEIQWVNDYHAWVYAEVAPLLNAEEAAWLKEKCKAL
jgi:Xaa-Pro aminopeptidase